jgi:hypothetical protein
MFNKPAILLTPVLLAGILAEKQAFLTPEDPGPYHARVREAVDAMPTRAGAWEGVDAEVPEPAQKLLRPNKLLARRYLNTEGGGLGTLLFVHCRDSRDLGGHHPPVCYPAAGWTAEAANPVEVQAGDVRIPAMRYEFSQDMLGEQSRQVVYAFFVLPDQGMERNIKVVRAAAADYRMRRFGAAQVQVVLPGSFSGSTERQIVSDLVQLAMPAIRAVRDRDGEANS